MAAAVWGRYFWDKYEWMNFFYSKLVQGVLPMNYWTVSQAKVFAVSDYLGLLFKYIL